MALPVRVLALDYGSARCGVAVSDPTGVLATPLEAVLKPERTKYQVIHRGSVDV